MSSAAGRVTRPSTAVYNASKFAVGAFSDVLRQEVADRGVRVIVVEPGAVDTPLREQITDAGARATLERRLEHSYARSIPQMSREPSCSR